MDIRTENHKSGGRYVIGEVPDEAEMTFSRASPQLIIIDHTAIPDKYRHQGMGEALAGEAVRSARAGGWKIIPLCPFFKAQAERHPDWQDVIKA